MALAVSVVLLAYLLGSIPTGVLLARAVGVDVRAEGSGNIGATNVARTAGRSLGVATLLGDVSKGVIPVVLARSLGLSDGVIAAVAVAAIAGHVYSVFLAFRGGKGVATGLGVLVGLAPAAALASLATFGAAMAISRIVSVASIAAAVSGPVIMALLGYPRAYLVAGLAIAGMIVSRHAENIARLRAGTERRFRARP
ncbi:MAG: acyl phosphate:glycerol-3-phosphate acyltransferase [Candidatus Binatota bacterium]|nr:acyl phosphate:glycerol-3-phosphate acyltransferase [Candidatus Binatota bacterium]